MIVRILGSFKVLGVTIVYPSRIIINIVSKSYQLVKTLISISKK